MNTSNRKKEKMADFEKVWRSQGVFAFWVKEICPTAFFQTCIAICSTSKIFKMLQDPSSQLNSRVQVLKGTNMLVTGVIFDEQKYRKKRHYNASNSNIFIPNMYLNHRFLAYFHFYSSHIISKLPNGIKSSIVCSSDIYHSFLPLRYSRQEKINSNHWKPLTAYKELIHFWLLHRTLLLNIITFFLTRSISVIFHLFLKYISVSTWELLTQTILDCLLLVVDYIETVRDKTVAPERIL